METFDETNENNNNNIIFIELSEIQSLLKKESSLKALCK